MEDPTASNEATSYVSVWILLSAGIVHTCSHKLPKILGHNFKNFKEPAYLAIGDTWLDYDLLRLDLLTNKTGKQVDKYTITRSQISHDGTLLALLSINLRE